MDDHMINHTKAMLVNRVGDFGLALGFWDKASSYENHHEFLFYLGTIYLANINF